MATNLQSGSPVERACSGGYTRSIVRFEGGAQVGNYVRALGVGRNDLSALPLPFTAASIQYGALPIPLGVGADGYCSLVSGFRGLYTIRPPEVGYNEAQAAGGYTKKMVRVTAQGGALDFLANPLTSTTELAAGALQRGNAYAADSLVGLAVLPGVGFQKAATIQVEPLGSASEIPAPAIGAAVRLGAAQFSTATTLGAKRSSAAIIGAVQFRTTTTIPICSGIGIKPAGTPITPEPVRGASVSFRDFTLGWAELHRFLGVNEQPTAMPSMTFDASGTSVVAWTGGQYVGPCIPGIGTADLATAWETNTQAGGGGNYVF